MCHFVLVFFSPFSSVITLLGKERANLSAFRTFVRFVLVWICQFSLPLGVWEGLRFVIVALHGLSLTFFFIEPVHTIRKRLSKNGSIVYVSSTINIVYFFEFSESLIRLK